MTREIWIQDLPDVPNADAIPAGHVPRPIGPRGIIVDTIRSVLPMVEAQDTDWFFAKGTGLDLSMQLHMENADEVRYIVVHVHDDDQGLACIAALLRALRLRAMDTATGDLFDAVTLEEGL